MKPAVLMLLVVGGAALGQAAAATRSVNDGVYTVEQSERGRKVFAETCTACHDPGRFTGEVLIKTWSGKPLHALFDVMKTMPEDNPGSLPAQDYADVLSYFLSLNKYPPGAEELKGTEDAMKAVLMEAPK